jgi:hypothetical protein
MKRLIVLVTVLAAAAVLVTPLPVAAAGHARTRAYAGQTSTGDPISIVTSVRDGVVRLRQFTLEGTKTCEDGRSVSFGSGFHFGRQGPVIPDAQLTFEDVSIIDAIFLSGRLGAHGGSGTISHLSAAFDTMEQPQICTTGELTWTVERAVARSVATPQSAAVATTVADGVTKTAWLGGAPPAPSSPQASGARIRSYEGRTSNRDPLFIATIVREGSVALLELVFQWPLQCDDGSSFGLGFAILFGEEPQEPGRLDYDIASPDFVFHVHGRLGAHEGSGTVTAALPALTAELEAQACRTGDLTWRAWRIDQGAR